MSNSEGDRINNEGDRIYQRYYCHTLGKCNKEPPIDDPERCQGATGPTGPRGATGATGPDSSAGDIGATGFVGLRYSDYNYGITTYEATLGSIPALTPNIFGIYADTNICDAVSNGVFNTYQSDTFPMGMSFTRNSSEPTFICDVNFSLALVPNITFGETVASTDHIALYIRAVDGTNPSISLHGISSLGVAPSPHNQMLCLREFNVSNVKQDFVGTYVKFIDGSAGYGPTLLTKAPITASAFDGTYNYNIEPACYSWPVYVRLLCYYTVPIGSVQTVHFQTAFLMERGGVFQGYINHVTGRYQTFNGNPPVSGMDGIITNMSVIGNIE